MQPFLPPCLPPRCFQPSPGSFQATLDMSYGAATAPFPPKLSFPRPGPGGRGSILHTPAHRASAHSLGPFVQGWNFRKTENTVHALKELTVVGEKDRR